MEPYDELGVSPTATAAEIRQAYVRLARRFHPDHQAGDVEATRRMSDINAAWTVLGDEGRRARYDAARRGEADGSGPASGATVRDTGDTWTPLDDGEDVVDPRLLDDTPTGAPSVPRWLTLLPALLLVVGLGQLMFGAILGEVSIMGAGLGVLVVSGIAFVGIPVVAMINSSRAERDW